MDHYAHYDEYYEPEQFTLLGHSYVRSARRYISDHQSYRNLKLQDGDVMFESYARGKKILFVEDVEAWIHDHPLHIKFASVIAIEISSNDLQEKYHKDPWGLADKVFKIAQRLRRAGALRVVLMQCLYRQGSAAIPHWDQDLSRRNRRRCMDSFNKSVRIYNSLLKYKCKTHDGTIVFRKQYGLKQNWRYVLKDGIHIRSSAMPKYLNNLRSCFIAQAIKSKHS